MKKKQTKYYIDFLSAVTWMNKDLIMFNDKIFNVDPDFGEDNPIVYEKEFFQFFLTNYSENDVKYMREWFPDVIIAYSYKLDLYILCVDNFGTGWDYVWTECRLPWLKDHKTWDDQGNSTFTRTHDHVSRLFKETSK